MTTNLDHLAEAVATRLRRTGHLEMLTRRDQFRLALAGALLKNDGFVLSERLRRVADMADCLMADDPVAEWEKRRPKVEPARFGEPSGLISREEAGRRLGLDRELFDRMTREELGAPWVRPDGSLVSPSGTVIGAILAPPGTVAEIDAHGRLVAAQVREPTPPPGGETEARDASEDGDDPGPGPG